MPSPRATLAMPETSGSPNPTAELTWALILAHLRHIPEEVQRLKQGQWQKTIGVGLKDRTLGVYAYGKIGSVVANVGRAFGMKVICLGREASTTKARGTTARARLAWVTRTPLGNAPRSAPRRGRVAAASAGHNADRCATRGHAKGSLWPSPTRLM